MASSTIVSGGCPPQMRSKGPHGPLQRCCGCPPQMRAAVCGHRESSTYKHFCEHCAPDTNTDSLKGERIWLIVKELRLASALQALDHHPSTRSRTAN